MIEDLKTWKTIKFYNIIKGIYPKKIKISLHLKKVF
jgi:hypothetical protein